MPSLEVTNFLESMKRKGEVLSIKDLNAQINAMMQAICLVEDEDSRIQFMKRIETVQKDLHCLRSKLESEMPRNPSMPPSTLNIDHSRLLIGSPEEGYMSLTQKIWQKVQDIIQKIDRISEGLVFIVQRHRDSSRQPQASKPNVDRYPRSDHPSHLDPYVQNKIQQTTHRSKAPDYKKSDNGSNYSSEYPQSDGSQVQTSFNHAAPYYHLPNISQPLQQNQFTQTPRYLNPQLPNMNHYDRFLTSSTSSSSQQVKASGNHSQEYFTGYPSGNLNYFPGGRQSERGGPSYQALNMPGPPGSPFWRIPADMPNVAKVNSDTSSTKYRSEGSDRSASLREYLQNSQKKSAKHAHRSRN